MDAHAHAGARHGADPSLNRLAFSATVHCLTGCAIGEVLGMVIGTALGWCNFASIVALDLLAFVFGYGLTSLPLLRAGHGLRRVAPLAFASDTASITTMEIVDNLSSCSSRARSPPAWATRCSGGACRRAADRGRGRVPRQPLAARPRQGPRRGAPHHAH